jgi:hypothetical protein
MPRRIIYSEEFDEQARALGGIPLVDQALDPITDALQRNPRSFNYLETDWFRIRYAITKPFGNIPALLVYFQIDADDDVIMEWVENYAPYQRSGS